MGRGMRKSERLKEMERLYFQHREGLSDIELAERFNVDRTTIFRDRNELDGPIPLYEVETGRYAVDRMKYISAIRVNLTEALALYLAARRMSRHTRTYQGHVVSALEKLAAALKEPMTEHLVHAATAMTQQPPQPERVSMLETLTRSWAEHFKVRLDYKALRAKNALTYTFSPYLIEPSLWSDAIYAIGRSDFHNDVVTLKVDRIEHISLTTERFTIPEDFDEQTLLRFAWGIWTSDEEPVTVKLKFSGHAAVTRLKESIWHPLQKPPVDTEDGACLWEAPVAEWREMLPWIRGWGADCEVLEPPELREELMEETQRLAKLYTLGTPQIDSATERLLRCWGKTTRHNDAEFHPALFHMIDVAQVARILLNNLISARWSRVLARALDVEVTTLADWLPYVIAMHDIGKLTAAFQSQNTTQHTRLKAEGFPFGGWRTDLTEHHSYFGQAYLQDEQAAFAISGAWRNLWSAVIGGHHGAFGTRRTLKFARARLPEYEPPLWKELRALADRLLQRAFLTGTLPTETLPNLARATLALTGFTILCDWLGSDEKFFPPAADFNLPTYLSISADRARRAVTAAGFLQSTRSTTPTPFSALFPDKQPSRPLQAAVDAIPQSALDGPALVIIEAPTGEGKTEAALAIAHRLAQATETDALYYALPTTATSNQMFKRIREHLDVRLGLPGDVQLVHGQAHLQEDDLDATPLANEKGSNTNDMVTWFTAKKRALLAPFGVGTVDQAELAALNVRHVALRLIGLAGKVVIFDEVHAYDTYMTTIIERLLEWLAALGTSVIILSATLPKKQRAALARAYGAQLSPDITDAYPSVLVLPCEGEVYHATPPAYQIDRPLNVRHLHFTDDTPEAKAQWLLEKVGDGGCACWITNTVARAQEIYDELRHTPEAEGVDLSLLHARFPFDAREQLEKRITTKYGPPTDDDNDDIRPRGIVVGTQVLEQSLDLDFDVMVSDLAPIDLLLQRAGRLQRHARPRPLAHSGGPTLWVNVPLDEVGVEDLHTDAIIYDEFLLRQTLHILPEEVTLHLPRDYRPYVEAVYGTTEPEVNDVLVDFWNKLRQKQSDAIKEAQQRLIPGVLAGEDFYDEMAALTFEEDETGAAWIVAQTRLGRESVNLIPLEKLNATTARLYPNGDTVALNRAASPTMQRHLLRRHLRVSRPEIVHAIKRQTDLPKLFTRSARLKEYYPLWFENGQALFPKTNGKDQLIVTLDEVLGLVIKS